MLEEDIEILFEATEESMEHALDHLNHELAKIRSGKASPTLVKDIMIPYYGALTPLSQIANIKIADARTLTIEPWEKGNLGAIEKEIFGANLGLTPQNDGIIIRINLPPLTEDRRRDLAKRADAYGEDAKVSIRNVRRSAIQDIKNYVKNGYPEDAGKRDEAKIEGLMKSYYEKIEALSEAKKVEIMKV